MSNLTRRALLGSVSAGAVLYSQASWARMGHFFAGGGAAGGGGGQTIASITPSGTTFTSGIANGLVCTVTVAMSPSSPLFTGTLVLSGANSGGFVIATTGASNVFDLNQSSGGTASGTYSDITLTATQGGISNSPQHITPTLVGSSATQTITAVNLSNSSFTSPGTVGETVGVITVTMSPASPAFTGTLSLTGTNASDFTISGTTLEVNSSGLAAGSYSINVVATQAGATGSPFSQPETIVGSAVTSGLPTTLAMVNYGGSTQTAQPWRFYHVFGEADLPSGQVLQIKDSGGNTVPYTAARRSTGVAGGNTVGADFLVLPQQSIAGSATDTWTLSAVSGSWSTTLPGGKTVAQIVTDRTTNFSSAGVQFTNLRDNYSQPVNGGTFLISDTTGYTAGATVPTSHVSYYEASATGPTACDLVSYVVVPSSSMTVIFYETCFLNASTGAVTKVCLDDIRIKNGPRTIQSQTYRCQLAVTLNGSAARSWGANPGDGCNISFPSTAVDTTNNWVTVAGNKFSPGQLVKITTTGTLPAPLMPTTTLASTAFSVVETALGGSNFQYNVTVVMANTFSETGTAVQVEITGLSLGSSKIINGVYNIGNTVSPTGFTYVTYSSTGSVGTSVTGTATVSPDYWPAQTGPGSGSVNVSTIYLYADQASANGFRGQPGTQMPGAPTVTMTTQGSGTHTIIGETDIFYFASHSLRRNDGWVDWIPDNSGAFGGEPTYHAVQNLTYYVGTKKVYPLDPTLASTTASGLKTENYPSSFVPGTFNGIELLYNGGGAHPEYGSPWNQLACRSMLFRSDRTGYCTTGRVHTLCEAQGWLGIVQDEATGKFWAANGSPYGPYSAPLNQHTDSGFVFGNPSGYAPVDIIAPVPGPNARPRSNAVPSFTGSSHWHTGTTDTYCQDGCESQYQHIMEMTNLFMVYLTVNSPSNQDFASIVRNPITSGATFWEPIPHAGSDNPRGCAWIVNQITDALLVAAGDRPEKQYWLDVVNSAADYITYCQTAWGANFTALGGWLCESTGTGPPGVTNVTNAGGSGEDDDPGCTNFMQMYFGSCAAFAYLKWPSAKTQVIAEQGLTYINNIYGGNCSGYGNVYFMKVMNSAGWNSTYTSAPWSTVADMGPFPQGGGNLLWDSDGHTVHIIYDFGAGPGTNYIIPLTAGDRIWINDGWDTTSPPGGYGRDTQLIPTGVANNTWYYAQNIGTMPSGFGVFLQTCTLSTDAGGSSPVSWTSNTAMTTTLASNITSSSTAIALNGPISTSTLSPPYIDIIKIDSEFICVQYNTIACGAATASGTNTLTVDRTVNDVPVQFVTGSFVINVTNPSSIPAGTTITAVTGPHTATMSANATGAGIVLGDALTFLAASGSTTLTTDTGDIPDEGDTTNIGPRGCFGSAAASHSSGATVTAYPISGYATDVQNRTSTCPSPSILFGNGALSQGYSYVANARQAAGLAAMTGLTTATAFTNADNALTAYGSDGQPGFASSAEPYMSLDTSLI